MFSVARSFQKKKNIKKRLTKISYTIVMRSVSVFNRISRCFDKNIKKNNNIKSRRERKKWTKGTKIMYFLVVKTPNENSK